MAQVQVPPLARPTTRELANVFIAQRVLREASPQHQMAWDAHMWRTALERPGTLAKQPMLRRIFMVLRWGGLVFRPNQKQSNWRLWSDVGWPIASALCHGGRVMVQLPRTRPGQQGNDDAFFTWLTNGRAGTADCAERQGTHSTGNRVDNAEPLPENRVKVLEELKGSRFGASQFFGLSVGKSYGINLALGGNLNRTMANKQLITDNGDHGHLYMFYRPPTPEKFGGLLVGTEGEAPGRWGASGNYHSWNIGFWDDAQGYRPSKIEGQLGEQWGRRSDRQRFQLPDSANDNAMINGPDRYDSMVIDLTSTGWQFIRQLEDQWQDAMVGQTAQAPRALTEVPKRLMGAMREATRLGGAVEKAAREYMRLSKFSLQLRLALFTDQFQGRVPANLVGVYNAEFNDLVRAIYGV